MPSAPAVIRPPSMKKRRFACTLARWKPRGAGSSESHPIATGTSTCTANGRVAQKKIGGWLLAKKPTNADAARFPSIMKPHTADTRSAPVSGWATILRAYTPCTSKSTARRSRGDTRSSKNIHTDTTCATHQRHMTVSVSWSRRAAWPYPLPVLPPKLPLMRLPPPARKNSENASQQCPLSKSRVTPARTRSVLEGQREQ